MAAGRCDFWPPGTTGPFSVGSGCRDALRHEVSRRAQRHVVRRPRHQTRGMDARFARRAGLSRKRDGKFGRMAGREKSSDAGSQGFTTEQQLRKLGQLAGRHGQRGRRCGRCGGESSPCFSPARRHGMAQEADAQRVRAGVCNHHED